MEEKFDNPLTHFHDLLDEQLEETIDKFLADLAEIETEMKYAA